MKKILLLSAIGLIAYNVMASNENYRFVRYDNVSAWTDFQCTVSDDGYVCNGQCFYKQQKRQVCESSAEASCNPGQIDTITVGFSLCRLTIVTILKHCECASS